MSNKNLFASFVTGAAAGAVLGLLFAPTSGEETRRKIIKAKKNSEKYLNQMVEDGKNSWYKTKGKMEEGAGIAAEEVDDFISHILKIGENWWSRTKNRSSRLMDEAEETANDVVQDGKKSVKQMAKEGRSTINELHNHMS